MLAPHVARAGDDEWHAGGRLGVVHVAKTGFEPAVGLHGAYGLSDMFDATVEVLGSHHVGSSGTDLLSATAGVAYKLDVFEWIPYVAALAGYYGYAGAPGPHGEHGSEFGASVQLGVDYLPMRELALGADVRWHASFHDGVNVPIYSATLGAEYRWGW
ncbi:MAG TPA: hypothetical protein VH062_07095 [Polyangiaceae bacterium]|nr:hypothetical protein [Polyangiaceae bacterium]